MTRPTTVGAANDVSRAHVHREHIIADTLAGTTKRVRHVRFKVTRDSIGYDRPVWYRHSVVCKTVLLTKRIFRFEVRIVPATPAQFPTRARTLIPHTIDLFVCKKRIF
jgi:hypothetical protein